MTRPEPRVGVVGTGYWGKNLLRNFDTLGALAAMCESDAAMRAERASAYDVPAYDSMDAMLGDSDVTAVAIATPAATHGALARQALEAGRHVFVEKPLCLDLAEAEALGAFAEQQGLTLMVGHLLLYHPAFVALCQTMASGKLGRLRYIYSNRASLGKIRREEKALWSFAPHDVSMILALSDAMPERVTCSGGAWLHPPVADTSLTHMTFPDGLQAHIFVSWLHPYKDHRLVVVGEDAMAVFDDVQPGADKLRLFRHQVGWNGEIPSVDKAAAEPIPYGGEEPLAQECAHFLNCVRSGATPRSNANEGRRVLAVLDACERALKSGDAVVPT